MPWTSHLSLLSLWPCPAIGRSSSAAVSVPLSMLHLHRTVPLFGPWPWGQAPAAATFLQGASVAATAKLARPERTTPNGNGHRLRIPLPQCRAMPLYDPLPWQQDGSAVASSPRLPAKRSLHPLEACLRGWSFLQDASEQGCSVTLPQRRRPHSAQKLPPRQAMAAPAPSSAAASPPTWHSPLLQQAQSPSQHPGIQQLLHPPLTRQQMNPAPCC